MAYINCLLLLQCIDIARILNYILDIGGRCMTTNLNIRTDKNIKDQAEEIFQPTWSQYDNSYKYVFENGSQRKRHPV